jgi:hypothetical protein
VTGGIGEGEVGVIQNVVMVRVVGVGRNRTAGDRVEPERKPWLVQGDETQCQAHPFGEGGTDFRAEAGRDAAATSTNTPYARSAATGS